MCHARRDGDLEIYTLAIDKVPTAWREDPRWRSPQGGGNAALPAHLAKHPSRWLPAWARHLVGASSGPLAPGLATVLSGGAAARAAGGGPGRKARGVQGGRGAEGGRMDVDAYEGEEEEEDKGGRGGQQEGASSPLGRGRGAAAGGGRSAGEDGELDVLMGWRLIDHVRVPRVRPLPPGSA